MVCSCGNDHCEMVQDDDLHLCCFCATDGHRCKACYEEWML